MMKLFGRKTKRAKYSFNPHKHVKIWFSKNPDVFLTMTNQLRLIYMRQKNPKSDISLIYDRRLLNSNALKQFETFCFTHQIQPIDAYTFEAKTEEEKTLISLYEDEIFHLDEEGNLGAASDIIRCMKGCYALGTYSDCDVDTKTNDLPDRIDIEEPVLFNCGNKAEHFYTANDIIGVADLDAALPIMQTIQRTLIANCTPQKPTLSNTKSGFSQEYVNEKDQFHKQLLKRALENGFSARTFRHFISKLHGEVIRDILVDSSLSFDDIFSLDLKYKKEQLNEPTLTPQMQRKKTELLTQAVVNSTGPRVYSDAIFQCPKSTNASNILLYGTLSKYNLNSAFNAYTPDIPLSDASWLPSGAQKINQNEEKMIESAKKIQRAFKWMNEKSAKRKKSLVDADEASHSNAININSNKV